MNESLIFVFGIQTAEDLKMPEWLPNMIKVNPWSDQKTYDELYRVFCRDIRNYDLRYFGNKVRFFYGLEDGKEKIFWHLTSRQQDKIPRRKMKFHKTNQDKPERLPDLRRCERLNWIKPIIEHPTDGEVLSWDYEEGNSNIRTYVWIKNFDFVVIMKKMPNGKRMLITSFYVDKEYKRNDFERKYENRLK